MSGKTIDDGWKQLDISVLELDDELIQYMRFHFIETLGSLVELHGDPPEVDWVPEKWRDAVKTAYGRFWAERSTSAAEAAAESKGDQ